MCICIKIEQKNTYVGQLGNTPMNNHKVQAPVITALLKAGSLIKSKYPLKRVKKFGCAQVDVYMCRWRPKHRRLQQSNPSSQCSSVRKP